MKSSGIFVAFTPRTLMNLIVAVFSIAFISLYNFGLSIPNDYCAVRFGKVLGGTGIVQPFFCILYSNFSFKMPRTAKNLPGNVQGAFNGNVLSTKRILYFKGHLNYGLPIPYRFCIVAIWNSATLFPLSKFKLSNIPTL